MLRNVAKKSVPISYFTPKLSTNCVRKRIKKSKTFCRVNIGNRIKYRWTGVLNYRGKTKKTFLHYFKVFFFFFWLGGTSSFAVKGSRAKESAATDDVRINSFVGAFRR